MNLYIPAKTSYKILKCWSTSIRMFPIIPKGKRHLLIQEIFFWFCLSNLVLIWLASLYTLIISRKNLLSATHSWIEVAGFGECIVILVYSKCYKLRLKNLFSLVEKSLENESTEEAKKYGTSYALIFIIDVLFYILTISMYIFYKRPTSHKSFITTAAYPFDTETIFCKTIVLFNQIFSIFYANIIPNFDGFIALFIFTCTHQFEVLNSQFKNAKNSTELRQLIKEHNNIIRLVETLNFTIRFMVLKTVISFITNALSCGLLISNKTELPQLFYMLSMLSVLYGRLYLCAESAENMSQAAANIGDVIYATNWYDEKSNITFAKLFIIKICQGPPVISVKLFMKKLDRQYMGTILYLTYSYIMTLRSITIEKY